MSLRFVATRLGMLALTVLVSSLAIYGAMFLTPGDPATLLVGGSRNPDPAVLAQIHREYHLDDPFIQGYWHWLSNFLQGDFGKSLVYRDSVARLIGARAGDTLALVAYASVLVLVGGTVIGTVAALRGGRTETLATTLTAGAMAVPTFVMAVLLIWLFAVQLPWFPVYGSGEGFTGTLAHLTLPAVALALSWIGYVAQVTRTAVRAEMRSEHVETARSRGVPERTVIRRHVLHNASGPVFAVSGVGIAGLIATAAVAEQAFGTGGLGALMIEAASKQDMAVVQAVSLIFVVVFVVINTTVDLVSAAFDPRAAQKGAAR
ncbi:Glutathione transport system permease protein GsiC [Streptomyces hundungensis]|uniref:Glutathione transport system permease protein GsiC n=1 Tax=Streptomyces hundungensis TaxID=1077946 RepID=A0A387H7P0_9ACTN|nr:ABC transporter permease [Streptomyces hundungensis]AYG79845.1 Glutathione transport system permease protein GsiC [Streptomyces hundungensis]